MLYYSLLFFAPFLFQGALFSDARPSSRSAPITASRIEITGQLETILLGPEGPDRKMYSVVPLPEAEQDRLSDSYEIVEKFMERDAILKVLRKDDSGRTEKEVEYLKVMQLFLDAEEDGPNGLYYIITKNVRKGEVPFKPFHEWYLEDENMDLKASIEKAKRYIESDLVRTAQGGLLYHNFNFMNMFLDQTLTTVMPIGWSPSDAESAGVEEVQEETSEDQLDDFGTYLQENIPERFTIEELATVLERSGNQLRPADAVLA